MRNFLVAIRFQIFYKYKAKGNKTVSRLLKLDMKNLFLNRLNRECINNFSFHLDNNSNYKSEGFIQGIFVKIKENIKKNTKN